MRRAQVAESVANTAPGQTGVTVWPAWSKWAVSLALVYHLAAVIAAALAYPPASPLEMRWAEAFRGYYQLTDLRQSHRYYGDIPPTPIAEAEIHFGEGLPSKTVRLPDPSARPRIAYQRQLALAYHLAEDVRNNGPEASLWARSYARHLCALHPGCTSVTLRLRAHLIPDPDRLLAGKGKLDVDAEEFFTTPERIGDFPCPPR